MVGRRSQRKKVASPPQEDPMVESSIRTPQAGHTEQEPQPDPPTELETVTQSLIPVLPLKHSPDTPSASPIIPSTSPDQAQFARMSIDDEAESGESSYRTTMPAPEAISFRSPDVLEQEHDDEDEDDDSIILIEPCKNFKKYSSWLKFTIPFLIKIRHINHIDNVLMIHDWESLFKYYYYGPKQWVDLLGKVEYLKHYKFLIKLNCIWTVTIN